MFLLTSIMQFPAGTFKLPCTIFNKDYIKVSFTKNFLLNFVISRKIVKLKTFLKYGQKLLISKIKANRHLLVQSQQW